MPQLKVTQPGHPDIEANTFEEKIEMLKTFFFPPPPEADLSDLPSYIYPSASECPIIITEKEVLQAIKRPRADKAPGPDGVTNRVLQACAEVLKSLLTPIFQAYIDHAYHPHAYKCAHTIILKKPQKDDYTTPKAWQPIALLNTTGKALESIMATKISHLTEMHQLIPNTQMGARQGKSTESALELLTEQIHTVWGQGKDKVATLFSLDVVGAFDAVSHEHLIHNLCKRWIPEWITCWVKSFLVGRRTTLAINQKATDFFPVSVGIPQGSPISPILYLYYNADLFEICERPGTATSALDFIDDVNILAYGTVAKCFVSPPAPKRHHMPHRASADVVQRCRGIFPRGHFRLIEADAHFFHSQVARF